MKDLSSGLTSIQATFVHNPCLLGNSRATQVKFANAEKLFVSQFCYDKPDETLKFLKDLQKIEKDEKKIANINRNIADIYLEKAFSASENLNHQKSLFNEALKNYQTFLEFFDEPNQDLVKIYNNIGIINYNLGNHNEALKNYEMSLSMIESLGQPDKSQTNDNKIILAKVNHNIGNVYYDLENYSKALNYFTISLDIFKSLNLENEYSQSVYLRMSFVYQKMGQDEKVTECQRKALECKRNLSECKRDDDLIPNMQATFVCDESQIVPTTLFDCFEEASPQSEIKVENAKMLNRKTVKCCSIS